MIEFLMLLACAAIAVVVIGLGVALGLHIGPVFESASHAMTHAEPMLLQAAAVAVPAMVLGIIALLLVAAWKSCKAWVMAVVRPDSSRQFEA